MKYKRYPSYKDSGVEWLGEIPEHWRAPSLKWYISIGSGEGLHNSDIEKAADEINSYEVIGGNGVLGYTHKVNTKNKAISIGRVGALCGNVHFIEASCWITDNALRISYWNRFDEGYLVYMLKAANLNNYANRSAQPLITGEQVKSLKSPKPCISEEESIANYLDKATTKIDTLIEKQTKLIELLKEKRQAVISSAVTRGLDASVPMKDSGVEWLGEIPEHWDIWKFIHLAPIITCGYAATPEYFEEGVPFLSAQNIKNGELSLHKYNHISENLHSQLTKNRKPEIGDLLVTRVGAKIGEACVLKVDMEFSIYVSLSQIRLKQSIAVPEYIKYFLASSYCAALNECGTEQGGGVGNLNVRNVEQYKIPLPNISKQFRLANYLDKTTSKIDNLITKSTQSIDLLKEKRTALISAAVTGKIDVRDAA